MTLPSVHSFKVNGINMFHIGTGTLLFGATVEWIPATVPVQFPPNSSVSRYFDQINIQFRYCHRQVHSRNRHVCQQVVSRTRPVEIPAAAERAGFRHFPVKASEDFIVFGQVSLIGSTYYAAIMRITGLTKHFLICCPVKSISPGETLGRAKLNQPERCVCDWHPP
jgi:hypothetical protein